MSKRKLEAPTLHGTGYHCAGSSKVLSQQSRRNSATRHCWAGSEIITRTDMRCTFSAADTGVCSTWEHCSSCRDKFVVCTYICRQILLHLAAKLLAGGQASVLSRFCSVTHFNTPAAVALGTKVDGAIAALTAPAEIVIASTYHT